MVRIGGQMHAANDNDDDDDDDVADRANDSVSLTCKFGQTLIMPKSPKFELLLIPCNTFLKRY